MDENFDISVEELKALLGSGEKIHLIDVREEYEFEADNLGGHLIPLGEIPDRIDELEALKGQEIYLHCRSGARSGNAKNYLISQGFNKVHNVIGGILAYRAMEAQS